MAWYLYIFILGAETRWRSNMRPPGRIKISSYHAHEFYKTIKKRGIALYTTQPCKSFGDAGPDKCGF